MMGQMITWRMMSVRAQNNQSGGHASQKMLTFHCVVSPFVFSFSFAFLAPQLKHRLLGPNRSSSNRRLPPDPSLLNVPKTLPQLLIFFMWTAQQPGGKIHHRFSELSSLSLSLCFTSLPASKGMSVDEVAVVSPCLRI